MRRWVGRREIECVIIQSLTVQLFVSRLQQQKRKKRSIRLFSMVWFGCIAAGVALTTFTALLLYYSDWINRYTWDKTQPAFSSQISRVCLSGTIDEWFVWDSGIRSVFFFCCIDVAAPSIGKHCRLEIVDFRLLSILKKFSRGWFRLSEIVNINRCEKIIKYYDGKQSLDRVLMDLTKMFRFFQFPARIFNTFSPLLFPLLAAVSNVSLPLHGIKAYQVFNETLHFA